MTYTRVFSIVALITVALVCAAAQPSLQVPRCEVGSTMATDFFLDDGSAPAIQQTAVNVCYDDEYIYLKPMCTDNDIMSPFTECNQDLFQSDVFEVFISEGFNQPTNYLEVELSPYGVLFVSNVANTDNDCSGITDTLIDCGASGIQYNSTATPTGWLGYLALPFSTIQNATYAASAVRPDSYGTQFRMNMYRIDTPSQTYVKEYSCWNPTDKSPACFHVPSTFGYITLV
ncbi:hypothetical protein SAMD00019534_030750 [Acytostelium subglobosum LB1]|uniref:hypothetical protein n=1 Tax=Acytostelium subglobosum LB1 TaxID=1410327 RepID=UPI000644B447|nr:hypothetical protein SAMD00019534_030750 [Acytostelium subglobosum LB1]GAM19900.1 hypothetical protein SAMD00019534_030750 [Acytostelium subglobosum LB1]|eukprot:XP_012756662.1 hypothetical protein SAMD00019534_030750 [Acytostelium subglobosum LB1]